MNPTSEERWRELSAEILTDVKEWRWRTMGTGQNGRDWGGQRKDEQVFSTIVAVSCFMMASPLY
ncbi:MAG: hypothetical protein JO215_14955 [Ktedonobacteraceae bacterium]|nr:hypothetical protein [Ktedonobacteraceae bacterium]MBV9614064.1 hypothetical protein [Ktedonobacteraceae bacterium]MBV9711686.1 hypothetical protein [Ktedonobacteraceae bacterium]